MACFLGCSPWLTRPTSTLISKTCSALRSQLLCSSWCHLNLVPAGLSGVDKTSPPSTGLLQKKRGLLLWRWITLLVTLVPFPPKPRWSANAIKAINLQQKGVHSYLLWFCTFLYRCITKQNCSDMYAYTDCACIQTQFFYLGLIYPQKHE